MTILDMPGAPELPSKKEMDERRSRWSTTTPSGSIVWNYERSREQLVTLYNRGAASQWQSAVDLDWSTDVDPEKLVDLNAGNNRLFREARRRSRAPRSPPGATRSTSRSGSSS